MRPLSGVERSRMRNADFALMQSCGYDSHGDLFVDGLDNARSVPLLAELPKGH